VEDLTPSPTSPRMLSSVLVQPSSFVPQPEYPPSKLWRNSQSSWDRLSFLLFFAWHGCCTCCEQGQ